MEILHILKSEADHTTKMLITSLSEERNVMTFPMYEDDADYEELIDLIFESDKVVSWW